MQFKITDTEPFDVAALGVFNVTGRNMEERELKLWDMVETIVDYPQAICIGARRPLRCICASGRSVYASGLAGNIL